MTYRRPLAISLVLIGALALTSAQAWFGNAAGESSTAIAQAAQPQAATRVVALTSLSADLIERLNRDTLIGIPGTSLTQSDPRFAGIDRVSSGRTPPSLETIVALEPDLVVGADGFHDMPLTRLDELGIPTLSYDVKSWQDLRAIVTDLAESIAADPQPLLTEFDSYLENPPEQSQSTLVLMSQQPILSPSASSWAGDLLSQFNVDNITAQMQGKSAFEGYLTLSAERILDIDPDIVMLIDTGEDTLAQFESQPFWEQLQAQQSDRVYLFDYYGLINPGSVESIRNATTQLREVFAD
ncbi:MAG: ABC transporter substrate-binding protein [Cyanobacteria bacterium P01_F01_bin.33]